jgi:hypothetical protein
MPLHTKYRRSSLSRPTVSLSCFACKFGYETLVQGQPKALIFPPPLPLWYHLAASGEINLSSWFLGILLPPCYIASACTLCHTLALFALTLIQDQRCQLIFSQSEIIGIHPCTRTIAHAILDAVMHRLLLLLLLLCCVA